MQQYIDRAKIRKIRVDKGMKRIEIGYKMDCSETTVWAIENRKDYDPKISTFCRLAKVLGVDIIDLLL